MNIHPTIRFFTSGRPVVVTYSAEVDQTSSTGEVQAYLAISLDGAAVGQQESGFRTNDGGSNTQNYTTSSTFATKDLGEGTHYLDVKMYPNSTLQLNKYNISVEEK
jgi:hypothetical protein